MSSKLLTVFGGQKHFWDELNTGTVFAGGLAESAWLGSGNYGSGSPAYTLVNADGRLAVRQTGTITRISTHILSVAGSNNTGIKWSVWRHLGSGTYRLISQSPLFLWSALTPNASNHFAVSLECRVGDQVGCTIFAGGYTEASKYSTISGYTPYLYKAGDATGDVSGWGSGAAGNVFQFAAACDPPAIAIAGDSIARGGDYWTTHTHASGYQIPALDPVNDPAYQIASRLGAGLASQNHGVGSMTWAGVLASGAPPALATLPRLLIVYCGGNDIGTGRALEDVLADMSSVKALVDAQSQPCEMAICEMIPWTTATDEQAATQRTWNSAFAAWAASNGVAYVIDRNAMGQVRVSTGYYDDLVPAYDDDGAHLTPAGISAHGELIAARLRSIP